MNVTERLAHRDINASGTLSSVAV